MDLGPSLLAGFLQFARDLVDLRDRLDKPLELRLVPIFLLLELHLRLLLPNFRRFSLKSLLLHLYDLFLLINLLFLRFNFFMQFL